jgi:hypothetical protein
MRVRVGASEMSAGARRGKGYQGGGGWRGRLARAPNGGARGAANAMSASAGQSERNERGYESCRARFTAVGGRANGDRQAREG